MGASQRPDRSLPAECQELSVAAAVIQLGGPDAMDQRRRPAGKRRPAEQRGNMDEQRMGPMRNKQSGRSQEQRRPDPDSTAGTVDDQATAGVSRSRPRQWFLPRIQAFGAGQDEFV